MPIGHTRRMQEMIERRPELNWSSITREALRRRMGKKNAILKSLIGAKLTVREVLQLDRNVKKALSKEKD